MFDNSPLAARINDVMEHGVDRRLWNPITPQVQGETAERMGHKCTHDHQGQSMTAHSQAEYRRAGQPTLSIISTLLAPPGESI
jgi:hypothetical protein